MAYRAATLPLRRRLIGSLAVLAGVGVVCVGFFVTITADATRTVPGGQSITVHGTSLPLSGGSGTAADALRHLLDHGVATGTAVTVAADVLYRAGVAAMAAAAVLAALLLLTPARGLIGAAAGIGFIGLALATAVTAGQSVALSTGTNGAVHAGVGAAVVVLALGFAVILAGGAVAAFRPLAGLVSGISLALTAVIAGVVVALVVGGQTLVHG